MTTSTDTARATEAPAMRATEISLGHGLVDIGPIKFNDRAGVLLRPRLAHIPVGDPGELQSTPYWPVEGDVVIWFDNEAGRQALVSMIAGEALTAARRAGAEEMRDRCAALIEQNQQAATTTKFGTERRLSPRRPGNLDGLAYATAIRAIPIDAEETK